jgi:N-acetylneuraminic acid mutarotase/predicted small lipoprotein YifL
VKSMQTAATFSFPSVFVILAALPLAGCGTSGNGSSPDSDAGAPSDSGTAIDARVSSDSGSDAGVDAPTDSGHDTSVVDAGPPAWAWMSGADVGNIPGAYGTLGVSSPTNFPGARQLAAPWTDSAGNLWMFGGSGRDSTANAVGELNDLWRYASGEWTWMGGATVIRQSGVYGTQGTPSPSNVPSARARCVSWVDAQGNFWLFGGSAGSQAESTFNDVWRYASGQWTWMSGPNVPNQKGVYGTRGSASPSNVPGARIGSASWFDATGTFWLFGGIGYDSIGQKSELNDLWKYAAGQWTWVSGTNVVGQPSVRGTLGAPDPSNAPGGRYVAASWTDPAGTFWLFGGAGPDADGTREEFNDLWKYAAGQWTWVGGPNSGHQKGSYGVQGSPSADNIPGAREGAVTWTDASGNLWLLGGLGVDGNGDWGLLNDLWMYSAGQWTWVSGSDTRDPSGVYGTKGIPSSANSPRGRVDAVSWTDSSGQLWLFGGGLDGYGVLNDLWRY